MYSRKLLNKTIPLLFGCVLLASCAQDSGPSDGSDKGGTTTGTATLSWNPPTENTDGSPLTDLAGYKIYYGTSADNLQNVITIDNPGISSYMVENLTSGTTYYFAMAAYVMSGNIGEFSTVRSKTI